MKRIALLVGLGLLAGCNSGNDTLGAVAPNFKVESLNRPGVDASIEQFKGKVILLDYWATWCGPCKQFMPYVQAFHEKYAEKGLEVMAISNEDRKLVQGFRNQRPELTFPIYLDEFNLAQSAFGVESYPTAVLINREGKVVFFERGIDSTSPARLDALIQKELG